MRTITLALTLLALTLAPRVHAAAGAAIPGEVYIAPGTSGTKAVPSSQTTNLTVSVNSTAGNGTNAFLMNATTAHNIGNLIEIQNNGGVTLDITAKGTADLHDTVTGDPRLVVWQGNFDGNSYAQYAGYWSSITVSNIDLTYIDPGGQFGGTPYMFDTMLAHTSGNLVEVKNSTTNYVQIPVDQASTNAPLILNINGTQKRVHVGAPDSAGTGLRALAIEN